MHCPAQLQRSTPAAVGPALQFHGPKVAPRGVAALADQCRLRQIDAHGGCTLRHAHHERRLPSAQAVAEPQQLTPDVFANEAGLQQPGKGLQQVSKKCTSNSNLQAHLNVAEVVKLVGYADQRGDEVWRFFSGKCRAHVGSSSYSMWISRALPLHRPVSHGQGKLSVPSAISSIFRLAWCESANIRLACHTVHMCISSQTGQCCIDCAAPGQR